MAPMKHDAQQAQAVTARRLARKRVTYPPYDTPIVRVCAHLPPSFPTPFPFARIAT